MASVPWTRYLVNPSPCPASCYPCTPLVARHLPSSVPLALPSPLAWIPSAVGSCWVVLVPSHIRVRPSGRPPSPMSGMPWPPLSKEQEEPEPREDSSRPAAALCACEVVCVCLCTMDQRSPVVGTTVHRRYHGSTVGHQLTQLGGQIRKSS